MAVDNPAPRVVLVRPLYGGNVGAAARAMANTGLTDLYLVDPQCLEDEALRRMAKGSAPIIDSMTVCSGVAEAVASCSLVIACTARPRSWKAWKPLPPEPSAELLLAHSESGNHSALMFGSEDNGLTQEDLAWATHLCHIPTGPQHSSLNLSQAVLLLGWEWAKGRGGLRRRTIRERRRNPTDMGQINGTIDQIAALLDRVGFFRGKNREQGLATLRQVLIRGEMTNTEIHYLRGVVNKLRWYADHGPRLED